MKNILNPMIITEHKLNAVPMDVFSELMKSRIIFFSDEVNDETAAILKAQLLYLNAKDPKKPINLYIDSPGGIITSGMSIIDTIRIIDAPVYTTCNGRAASMGALLLAAGEKGHRAMLKYSEVMIHQPLGGTIGQATDIINQAQQIEKWRKRIYDFLVERTGQSYKTIATDCERDYYMDADEALKYGIVDIIY